MLLLLLKIISATYYTVLTALCLSFTQALLGKGCWWISITHTNYTLVHLIHDYKLQEYCKVSSMCILIKLLALGYHHTYMHNSIDKGSMHIYTHSSRKRERPALYLTISWDSTSTFHWISDALQCCKCDLSTSGFSFLFSVLFHLVPGEDCN